MINTVKSIAINFKKYSFLLKQLVTRDFKVKYKRSALGIVWSLLYPILMMTVMAFVFSNMFQVRAPGVNYLVYLMTGIIVWNSFSEATNLAMGSVRDNFSLINKIYIPKYIFPFSKIIFSGVNFLLSLIPWVMIIILAKLGLGGFDVYIGWKYIFIIYAIICLFLFTLGIGLILSCLTVFLKDVVYIYGIVLLLWNYLTPVFYSLQIIPANLHPFFKLNPMYHFLDFIRQVVLFGYTPSLAKFLVLALSATVALGIGSYIFRKNQDKFIYYI